MLYSYVVCVARGSSKMFVRVTVAYCVKYFVKLLGLSSDCIVLFIFVNTNSFGYF